jgi:DNA-binding response OmpR family regulator
MRGKHILIVEDNFLIAEWLAELMRREGAVVEGPIGRAWEAIHFVNRNSADGVLLDVQLQDGTGVTVAKALRERRISFIVVTGYAQEMLPMELRTVPYIGKPISEQVLIEQCWVTFSDCTAGPRRWSSLGTSALTDNAKQRSGAPM